MRHASAPIMAAATRCRLPRGLLRAGRPAVLIGGCDAVELAREFGTPAYVMAEDDLRARAREFRAALETHHDGPGEVIFASKACPVTAVLRVFAEEGLGVRRRLGRRAAPRAEGRVRARADLPARQREVRGGAARRGRGGRRLDRGRQPRGRRQARARAAGRRAASACCCGSARASTPTRTPRSSPATRSRSSASTRARRARSPTTRPPHLDVQGFHFHLGSQLNDPTPYRAAVGVLAGLGEQPVYSLGGGYAVAYTADDRPPGIDGVRRRRGRGGARPARARTSGS